LSERERVAEFERVAMPHTKAAFDLARWLTRDEHDAEDVVQEAYLRAFKYFDGFNGSDARTWLLAIVRNTFYTWREKQAVRENEIPLAAREGADEESEMELVSSTEDGPAARMDRASDQRLVDRAIRALPVEFREAIVLRELEDLSYKEIATVLEVPLGTVMSRLARGREHLRRLLSPDVSEPDVSKEVPR
jgi:RNA polymerase sigma factor (sigma-70 family)